MVDKLETILDDTYEDKPLYNQLDVNNYLKRMFQKRAEKDEIANCKKKKISWKL